MSLPFTTTRPQLVMINDKKFHFQQHPKSATTTKSVNNSTKQQQQQEKTLRTDIRKDLILQENAEKEEESFFHHTNLPLIGQDDIRIGSCLGKGTFSKVYKIKNKRRLDTLLSSSSTSTSTMTKGNSSISSPSNKQKMYGSSSLSLVSALSSLVPLLPSNHSNNDIKEKCNNNSNIKKKYALKVLRNKILRAKEYYVLDAKLDMKKEIQALSLLHHENINTIYGYGYCSSFPHKNIPFLIMEEIECTLSKRMQDWHQDYDDPWFLVKEKINIAYQMLHALQYMHDCGYVYRDLKPRNIGLINVSDATRATTRVKLFDFGTCRKLPNHDWDSDCESKRGDEECYKMTFVGSPRYMAPELHGYKKYNEKVDVYSWSIVFFEILTLRKAFPSYSKQEYYKKIYNSNERPQFFDDNINDDFSVPREIQKILQHSWEGDISRRYTSKNAIEELQSYCDKYSVFFPKEE